MIFLTIRYAVPRISLFAAVIAGSSVCVAAEAHDQGTRAALACEGGKPVLKGNAVESSIAQNLGAMITIQSELCRGRVMGPAPAEPQLRALDKLGRGTGGTGTASEGNAAATVGPAPMSPALSTRSGTSQ